MSAIRKHAMQLNLDARITLYDIDLTALGGGIEHVSPMSNVLGTGQVLRITEAADQTGAAVYTRGAALVAQEFAYLRAVVRITGLTAHTMLLRAGSVSNNVQTEFNLSDPGSTHTVAAAGAGDVTDAEVYTSKITDDYAVVVLKAKGGAWHDQYRLSPNTGFSDGDTLDIVDVSLFTGTGDGVLARDDQCIPGNWTGDSGVQVALAVEPDAIGPLMWRGNAYQPRPVEVSGVEVSADGKLPRPKIVLGNVLGIGSRLCRDYRDMVGATVTRWSTYARFLDDGLTPDQNAHAPTQEYVIDQKTHHDNVYIEWEMASVLDQQGMVLPARQVIRDGCQLSYRAWDPSTGSFIYPEDGCPYVGSAYFGEDGTATEDASKDVCSHNLKGCKLRYPSGPIPFGGFPSAGRIRR